MTDPVGTPSALQSEDLANTVLAISREFISSKPYDEVLLGVCRRIAGFVRCLVGPNVDVWYVFPNSQLPGETKVFRFLPSGQGSRGPFEGGAWNSPWNADHHLFEGSETDALCNLIGPSFENGGHDAARQLVEVQQGSGRKFVVFSLCRLARPMGYILLPVKWNEIDLERLLWHVHYLQRKAFEYFEAFYQATSRTYLPSFYQRRTKPVSILFCDLRNSTTVFQVLRIGGDDHIRKFLSFFKAFMHLAAEYIVSSGLGTIYGFTGDGFMATFGDHIVPARAAPELHAAGAGALALFVAERLHRGFAHLYNVWRDKGIHSFDLEHNEDVGIRLGIGLGYGSVHFDEFGTSRRETAGGAISRGLLYYNAVGDHMNVAARLCGIAHAELSAVDIVDRPASAFSGSTSSQAPQRRADDHLLAYLAPIVATKPLALAQSLPGRLLPLPVFTTVRLKGIGNRIPVQEIWPEPLDLRMRPEEASRTSRFPPDRVAQVMVEATNDPFYATQVKDVGLAECETVTRLMNSLSSELQ